MKPDQIHLVVRKILDSIFNHQSNMKTNSENALVGMFPSIIFYFLFMFCLCFLMPSHKQFGCFICGIFIYPFILLFPVGLIVIIFIVLKLFNKKIRHRLPATTIYVYPMAYFVAMKLFRSGGEPHSMAIIAIVSCGIAWIILVFWGAYKLR